MILKYCKSFLVVGSVLFIQGVAAQSFSGVDDLGRVITQQAEVGSKKANKQVGIFYFFVARRCWVSNI